MGLTCEEPLAKNSEIVAESVEGISRLDFVVFGAVLGFEPEKPFDFFAGEKFPAEIRGVAFELIVGDFLDFLSEGLCLGAGFDAEEEFVALGSGDVGDNLVGDIFDGVSFEDSIECDIRFDTVDIDFGVFFDFFFEDIEWAGVFKDEVMEEAFFFGRDDFSDEGGFFLFFGLF